MMIIYLRLKIQIYLGFFISYWLCERIKGSKK